MRLKRQGQQRGYFITVEGGEGVGKSSFCRALATRLAGQGGGEIVTTHEPGGSPMADSIRQLFNAPPPNDALLPLSELFLVSAARAQHVERTIRPALARGAWVLCDRFADSSRVYQGRLGGIPTDFLEEVISRSTGGLAPDLTVLLDCDVAVSKQRMKEATGKGARGGAVRYDEASVDLHKEIRSAFLALPQLFPTRFLVLDATRSTVELVDEVSVQLQERFAND